MARKKTRPGRYGIEERTRDHPTQITSPRLRPLVPITPAGSLARALAAQRLHRLELEDRRRFHPLKTLAPPVASPRSARRIVSKTAYPYRAVRQAFNAPKKVVMCVRRKIRKEVMHALRKTGKGGGQRRPRWNFWSEVSCK